MNLRSYFQAAECLPHNCDCEFVRDGWIGQPSAFWSSLFYFFFAYLLARGVQEKTPRFKLWIFALVLSGFSSHFAHGSFIEFSMAMDFAGIVLLMSFFPLVRWLESKFSSYKAVTLALILYQVALWFVFFALGKWLKVFVCVVIFVACLLELFRSEGHRFLHAREMKLGLGLLLVSFIFFIVDETKILCEPMSWYQSHSVWHFGSALSLYYYGKWRFRESAST